MDKKELFKILESGTLSEKSFALEKSPIPEDILVEVYEKFDTLGLSNYESLRLKESLLRNPNTGSALLHSMVQDSNPIIREKAVLHKKADLTVLKQALNDKNEDVRSAVLKSKALGKYKDAIFSELYQVAKNQRDLNTLKELVSDEKYPSKILEDCAQQNFYGDVDLMIYAVENPASTNKVWKKALELNEEKFISNIYQRIVQGKMTLKDWQELTDLLTTYGKKTKNFLPYENLIANLTKVKDLPSQVAEALLKNFFGSLNLNVKISLLVKIDNPNLIKELFQNSSDKEKLEILNLDLKNNVRLALAMYGLRSRNSSIRDKSRDIIEQLKS